MDRATPSVASVQAMAQQPRAAVAGVAVVRRVRVGQPGQADSFFGISAVLKSLRKLHTGNPYVQFERRTEASVRATLRASSDPSGPRANGSFQRIDQPDRSQPGGGMRRGGD